MKPFPTSRKSNWILLFVLPLSLVPFRASKESSGPNSSAPDPAVRAVVQLLAVGPGSRGINQECSATGFLVNEEGYILTNAHVVEDARQCLEASPRAKIMAKISQVGSDPETGPAVSCDIVGLDDLHDLAVMKAERPPPAGTRYAFMSLRPGHVDEGTRVVVTGHPAFAWRPVTQLGRIIRRRSLRLSELSAERTEVVVLDITLQRGNSGSPVYLAGRGDVIGIIERKNPSNPAQTIAVPIHYAIELLDRHGVRWHQARD